MSNLALIAGKVAITSALTGTGTYTQLIGGSEKITHFLNIYANYYFIFYFFHLGKK